MANIKSDEWLQQRLSYIKALKSPSAQQSIIAMLAEKDTLTPAEEKS
jgi:hypothetical protein